MKKTYFVILVVIYLLFQYSLHAESAMDYYNLGHKYLKENNYLKALNAFKKSIAAEDTPPWSYQYAGVALRRMKKDKEALPYLHKAAELLPDNHYIQIQLYFAYDNLKKYTRSNQDSCVNKPFKADKVRFILRIVLRKEAGILFAGWQKDPRSRRWDHLGNQNAFTGVA